MGLIDDVGAGPAALDSVTWIYFVERNPDYLDSIRPVLLAADAGSLELVSSAISLLEVLMVPLRIGNLALAARYETLLTCSRGVRLVELTYEQLRLSANLRARYRLRTPDSLQVSAALSSACTAFVTNDLALPSIPGLRVLQLRDYR